MFFSKFYCLFAHLKQTDTDYPHLATQSNPDSQTDRPQNRNNASGCHAARSLHRSIGFRRRVAGGRSGCHVLLAPYFSSESKLACGPMPPDLYS